MIFLAVIYGAIAAVVWVKFYDDFLRFRVDLQNGWYGHQHREGRERAWATFVLAMFSALWPLTFLAASVLVASAMPRAVAMRWFGVRAAKARKEKKR